MSKEIEQKFLVLHEHVGQNALRCVEHVFTCQSLSHLSVVRPDLNAVMKEHEDFWKSVLHAHLSAAFTAMGRLYETDRDGRTLAALIAFAIRHRAALFSRDALRRRKLHGGLSKKEADELVRNIVDVEAKDFRPIQEEVARGRDHYNQKARPIRNDVFAHASKLDFSQSGVLFANLPVHEFEMLAILPLTVEESLYQCFNNGTAPVLEKPPWQIGDVMAILPKKQNGAWHHLHIASDVKKLLESISTNAALARRWQEDLGSKSQRRLDQAKDG